MTGLVTAHLSVSLDGYQVDAPLRDHLVRPRIGAYVTGRNMVGPIRGEWDTEWLGWWGDDPPYHRPVFVLTHRRGRPTSATPPPGWRADPRRPNRGRWRHKGKMEG